MALGTLSSLPPLASFADSSPFPRPAPLHQVSPSDLLRPASPSAFTTRLKSYRTTFLKGEWKDERALCRRVGSGLKVVHGCISASSCSVDRREFLKHVLSVSLAFSPLPALASVSPVEIDLSKEPSGTFDARDERLREAARIFEGALSAKSVEEEERLWTDIIDKCRGIQADWVNDIVSRAYGNRGNARSRQGKFDEALDDFTKSIELAPYAVDPVLNRGVILENTGRYEEAASDYRSVLKVVPNDPAAWNNLGNVTAALGNWDEALLYYQRASQLAPEFSFAAANYALALYQVGKENEAIKKFRAILRKYPEFPDVRAALAVSLYQAGLFSDAETNWIRLEDLRYKDRNWVKSTRRWPPKLVLALESFLDVRAAS